MTKIMTNEERMRLVGELKGLLSTARKMNLPATIVEVPVEMLTIDITYQTEERTNRNLDYLVRKFDDVKLLPLQGVPHDEEGLIYLTDGWGRKTASQIINPEKYKTLMVMVILNSPNDPDERRKFEAELYAFQNRDVAKLTPIQKRGAMEILEDGPTLILNDLQKKYGFKFSNHAGQRESGVIGSYSELLSICRVNGKECVDYILSVCQKSGFDRKVNGYSRYIMRSLKDAWKLYAANRQDTNKMLSTEFRSITPDILKARAVAKYPMLECRSAVSMYVEDLIVNELGLEQSREVIGRKLYPASKSDVMVS